MSGPHHADPDQISRFVLCLFRYAEGGTLVSLRTFDQVDGNIAPRIIGSPVPGAGSLLGLVQAAYAEAEAAAQADRPTVFCPPIATFDRRGGGKAGVVDLACGLALVVELDAGDPEAARTRLEGILGQKVTLVVHSGGESVDPATGQVWPRAHLYWRLNEATRETKDHDRLRQANRLACLLVGADPSGTSVVHPLRWPGSWHRKDPQRPVMARIAVMNDAAEIDLGDALERLEEAVAAAGMVRPGGSQTSSQGHQSGPGTAANDDIPRIEDVRAAMFAIPNPNRGESGEVEYWQWIRLGYALWRSTGGSAEGQDIWEEWSGLSDKFDRTGTGETVRTWHRIGNSSGGQGASAKVGPGTLFYEAQRHGWSWPFPFGLGGSGNGPGPGQGGQGGQGAGSQPGHTSQPAGHGRLWPITLTELFARPPAKWLVEGLVPDMGLVVPYGPPKGGKTFLMLSLALHVADDRPWFGHPVKGGSVVYVAGEGSQGLADRARAALQHYGMDASIPFFIIETPANLSVPADVRLLKDQIEKFLADKGAPPLALLIFDTLARNSVGTDENSAKEMGLVIGAADSFRLHFRCCVMLIHHEGKDALRGARGTSALRGAWDTAMNITMAGQQVVLTVTDQKEAEAGTVLTFDMVEVLIGTGRASLVPMLSGTPASQQPQKRRRTGGQSGVARTILEGLLAGPDATVLTEIGGVKFASPMTAVRHEAWRKAVYATMPGETENTRKVAFWRASNNLQKTNEVVVRDPWVWIP